MLLRRLTLIVYTAVLFYGTHIPLSRRFSARYQPEGWWDAVWASAAEVGRAAVAGMIGRRDKMIHLVAYALLTVLAFWAAASYPKIRSRLGNLWYALVLVGLLAGFGLFDEATQPWFGRSFEWLDYSANLAGILLTAALLGAALAIRGRLPWATDRPVSA